MEEAELLPESRQRKKSGRSMLAAWISTKASESFRLGMEKTKSEKIVEHPVYGAEDMEECKQCILLIWRLHDQRPGNRGKGRSFRMTFQNEEGSISMFRIWMDS